MLHAGHLQAQGGEDDQVYGEEHDIVHCEEEEDQENWLSLEPAGIQPEEDLLLVTQVDAKEH